MSATAAVERNVPARLLAGIRSAGAVPLGDHLRRTSPIREVLPRHGADLIDVIRRYVKCLAQDDQDLPDPFILQEIIDKHGSRQGDPLPPVVK